jgi:hypothetical protein
MRQRGRSLPGGAPLFLAHILLHSEYPAEIEKSEEDQNLEEEADQNELLD